MEDNIEIEINETNRGNEQIIKLLLIKNTNLNFHFKGKINQKFIDALNIRL